MKNILVATACMLIMHNVSSQEFDNTPSVGITSGLMNYQGDIHPTSFTFRQSNPYLSLFIKQPITRHLSFKAGFGFGKVQGDDKYNRDYLQKRNLNFYTSIKEAYAGFEIYAFPLNTNKITPYLFAGVTVFHFNPYTFTSNGNKVFLQPLSTEGQGLDEYPDRKPYTLTQAALTGAIGFKYLVNENCIIGFEFNQRKTFTDHLDDVSSSYVDKEKLRTAKGQLAVDLAFRGDEISNGNVYPSHGEQRGTPTEKDWYYTTGISAEINLNAVKQSVLALFKGRHDWYYKKCPRVY